MEIETFLAGNVSLGIASVVFMLIVSRVNRPFLRDVWNDPDRLWRVIARLALIANAALVLWITIQDNWRQLSGTPYRSIQLFPSKRIEYNPPSDNIRHITFILLGIALVFTACLLARHVGGYAMQIVILLMSVVAWVPFFILHQRLDINLALGFDGSWTNPIDALSYLLFVVLAWITDFGVTLLTYLVLLCVVALPVTLILDITRLRRPKVRGEANSYFRSLAHRP
jgi:hypothetical protein